MPEIRFRARLLRRFVDVLAAELGAETLASVLVKAGLPVDWSQAGLPEPLDEVRAAQAYARLQAAIRTYYGRGARGILLRAGERLWDPLLRDAPVTARARSAFVRIWPRPLRRKPALDLLGHLIGAAAGDVTVHTQDLDLLLVDHVSVTARGESGGQPICHVTAGLIRGALAWADGTQADVEEVACCATGAAECRFTIKAGG